MSASSEHERAAIEAVVRHVSALREPSGDSRGHVLSIDGRRVAVVVRTLEPRAAERGSHPPPGQRFDKVVLRIGQRLRDALRTAVPDGDTVLVAFAAPIRVAAKTAAVLEERIRACFALRSMPAAAVETIHGNAIGLRHVRHGARRAAKVIAFAHNAAADPESLLDLTAALLEQVGTAARDPAPASPDEARWLVLTGVHAPASVAAYRQILSQFFPAGEFEQILTVFADGRVEGWAE